MSGLEFFYEIVYKVVSTKQWSNGLINQLEVVRADSRHKDEINRLIREANIGPGLRGPVSKNTWVAKIDGRVVGFAEMEFISWEVAILKGIVVEREFRHRGIGSALINHRMNIARQRGVKIPALCTMFYTFHIYRRFGFETCKRKYLPEPLRSYRQFTMQRYKKCAVMVRGI